MGQRKGKAVSSAPGLLSGTARDNFDLCGHQSDRYQVESLTQIAWDAQIIPGRSLLHFTNHSVYSFLHLLHLPGGFFRRTGYGVIVELDLWLGT